MAHKLKLSSTFGISYSAADAELWESKLDFVNLPAVTTLNASDIFALSLADGTHKSIVKTDLLKQANIGGLTTTDTPSFAGIRTTSHVGIGIALPVNGAGGTGTALHVSGTDYPCIMVKHTDTASGAFFVQKSDSDAMLAFGIYGSLNAGAALFGIARANNGFIYTETTDLTVGTLGAKVLTLGTNNTARITVGATGRVTVATGLALPTAAMGTPVDNDIYLDASGSRLAVRIGGAWKYAALSA